MIDVSVWPTVVGGTCSLWRECEFRKVKSIMRQQRFDLTGTHRAVYIHNRCERQKREKEVKHG